MNRDTDKDGILDWEESLWGTDPSKRDTNDDGVMDSVEIAKIKSVTGSSSGESPDKNTEFSPGEEELTETDKFSREFFATIATLNQTGAIDQATVEKLSSALAEKIENSPQRKVYLISELKITKTETLQSIRSYDNALTAIQKKYPAKKTVLDVLQKFIVDENTVNVSVLIELDPIIIQTTKIITELLNVTVSESFAPIHLEFINTLQKLLENINDIKLYEDDVIVAFSAINQYDTNTIMLQSTMQKLSNTLEQKLKN